MADRKFGQVRSAVPDSGSWNPCVLTRATAAQCGALHGIVRPRPGPAITSIHKVVHPHGIPVIDDLRQVAGPPAVKLRRNVTGWLI